MTLARVLGTRGLAVGKPIGKTAMQEYAAGHAAARQLGQEDPCSVCRHVNPPSREAWAAQWELCAQFMPGMKTALEGAAQLEQ